MRDQLIDTILKALALLIIIATAIGIALLVIVVPIMLLWNAVVPDVFGLPEITFLQALMLSVLPGFLVRSSSYNGLSKLTGSAISKIKIK